MGAAAMAQCDESGSWIRKHYQKQLWVGGGRAVVSMPGHI
tara:strand:+ start:293 stop:412 length:120 start_codon:yes stop_codon:yes gene_type:complete